MNKSERENALFNFYKIDFILFSGESKKLRYIHPHRHNTLHRVQLIQNIRRHLQPIHHRHLAARPLRVQVTHQLSQNIVWHLQCSKEVQRLLNTR